MRMWLSRSPWWNWVARLPSAAGLGFTARLEFWLNVPSKLASHSSRWCLFGLAVIVLILDWSLKFTCFRTTTHIYLSVCRFTDEQSLHVSRCYDVILYQSQPICLTFFVLFLRRCCSRAFLGLWRQRLSSSHFLARDQRVSMVVVCCCSDQCAALLMDLLILSKSLKLS